MAQAPTTQATQKFVDVEAVRDGVVLLKGGGMRRILLVAGINFELKSEEEQNIITYMYQNLLNSLDFPVQFLIHSRKMNIDAYLEKLNEIKDRETNELLKNQIEEYVTFVKSFVESNAIMSKTLFVTVPYESVSLAKSSAGLLGGLFGARDKKRQHDEEEQSFAQKLAQLEQRTEQVISGLTQIGLRVVPLNDEEITELLYNLYNPQSVEKGKPSTQPKNA